MKNGSKRTVFLSRAERRIGGRYFLQFSGINGMVLTFLGVAPIYLLAVHFQATNFQLGLISAMFYTSGFILLVIPWLFQGVNVVTLGFWAWILRGIVSLGYACLLLPDGRFAVNWIILFYTLFCISRMVGVSMVTTVQKRLTTTTTQGDIVFRSSASFQGSTIISRIMSFLVLSIQQLGELLGILSLLFLGIFFNSVAAMIFRKIPNRTRVEYTKGMNLFAILRDSLAKSLERRILLIRWITISQHVLFGMAIPFLRRSVGLPSNQVLIFSLCSGLGAFLASLALLPVVERAGSRPVLVFTSIPLVFIFGIWAFLSSNANRELFFVMGFLVWFFLMSSTLAIVRLVVSITPEHRTVGFNSMEIFVTSFFALVLGLVAGGLIDLSAILSLTWPINDFGLIFLLTAISSIIVIILAIRITEPGSLPLIETMRILSHTGNLKAWSDIRTLENTADPRRRRIVLESLGHSQAPVASKEIRRILAEPLSVAKGDIIMTLFEQPRPALIEELHREASDVYAYHRVKAIFALGAYPDKKTHKLLQELLEDEEPLVRSTAAKSLGRIGAKEFLGKVTALAEKAVSLRELQDYMIALYHMDPQKLYLNWVFSAFIASKGEELERPLFTLIARQFGMAPPLGSLYKADRLNKDWGIKQLLEEARESASFLENYSLIMEKWMHKQYEDIWDICLSSLDYVSLPGELVPLKLAMEGFPREQADHANTLAALYFTYQLLTTKEETDVKELA